MNISPNIRSLADRAESAMSAIYHDIDAISRFNTEHVLDCFRQCEVSESLFAPSTGYGYGDRGRDMIDILAAKIFRAEAGFMRTSLLSGTHTLTVGLFGILRPGDIMLSISGTPYDTLLDVIGIDGNAQPNGKNGDGSLADFGVTFMKTDLQPRDAEGLPFDFDGMRAILAEYGDRVKMVYVQRSKGYADRPTLTVREIRRAAYEVAEFAKKSGMKKPVFMVDNCYGEFTEIEEPCGKPLNGAADECAVDLMAGSLIKNPGGGMADIGGYIVGTKEAVDLCGYRLTSPGVGLEVGASLGQNRNLIKGLFYAPHTVAQAMKTAHLAAYMFGEMGYRVNPAWDVRRSDIVQAVDCDAPEKLVAFCRGIQSASPIDAHVTPYPWEMPGYADPVIMAAGAFVGGASIELSADGPMRAPYTAFMQGGLTYESARLGIMAAADKVNSAAQE